jgi:cytosine/adenosine deaminase-related metal-dependent hydrolase
MKLLFKNAILLKEAGFGSEPLQISVIEDRITYIGSDVPAEDEFDRVIDCRENLIMPAFYNAHCHAAMTLFRGYGEDLPLQRWLDEKILPAEEKLNFRRVYYGTKLAIAEMIKNGIVFTTTEAATVTVWWVEGGEDHRQVALYDMDGNIVVQSDNQEAAKNDPCMSTFTVEAGTYIVGNVINTNYIFKVEVVVGAPAEVPAE